MAIMNVRPTRMELTRLKKQLNTALRGHKMLKDKRDELVRRFIELASENVKLREKVENGIKDANDHFTIAGAAMSKKSLDAALMCPKQEVYLTVSTKNVMSVIVPVYSTKTRTSDEGDVFSYGFGSTSFELDDAVTKTNQLLPDMLRLAETEKNVTMLADEIQKTRRRVNALEHVLIPRYQETIRYITMKLEENERSNRARLMKVKDMMISETIEKKKQN